jgi:hypothetical protein
MIGLDSVTKTLSEVYALSYDTSSQWAAFFVNNNMTWDQVHALTNMALYTNMDVEEVWKIFESWRILHEKDNKDSG